MINFIKSLLKMAVFSGIALGLVVMYFKTYGIPNGKDNNSINIAVEQEIKPSEVNYTTSGKRGTTKRSYTTNKTPASKYKSKKKKCSKLVMYSTSWCGACRKAQKDLRNNKVKYKEYVLDKNRAMNQKFKRKAKAAGRRIAYPTYEVDGKILLKNYNIPYLSKTYNLCKK